MKRIRLIMLISFLAACVSAPGPPVPPEVPSGFGWVRDTWLATVETPAISVERRVEISPDLAALLRGSPALTPTSLKAVLLGGGASDARCRTLDDLDNLAISCHYHYPFPDSDGSAVQRFPLPDDALLDFLAELPVELAQGIHIKTKGQVKISGVFTIVPASERQRDDNGGLFIKRYSLASLSELLVDGETRLSPGDLPATVESQPVTAGFLPRYLPGPANWLAFGFALVSALAAIGCIFQVGARLPLEPQVWRPDLERTPRLLRWFVILLARLINWIRRSWPQLLNGFLGTVLVGIGGFALAGAWNMAKLYNDLDSLRWMLNRMLSDLLLPISFDTLLWSGWPIVIALLGAGLVVIGVSLLARREMARLLVAGLVIATIGGHILLWPHLLLAPLLVLVQLEMGLGLGAGLLLTLALLARSLTHPQFRRYYGGLL